MPVMGVGAVIDAPVVRGVRMRMCVRARLVRVLVGMRLSPFDHQKTLPVKRVVGVRRQLATESFGKASGPDGPLNHIDEMRKGVEHRGYEHVARKSSHGVESDVHQPTEPVVARSSAIMAAGRFVPMPRRPKEHSC